jgi:hypothetical protein
VLAHDGLRANGLDDLRHWRDALADYLASRAARAEVQPVSVAV